MAVKPAEEKGAEYAPQVTLSGEGANAEFFKKKNWIDENQSGGPPKEADKHFTRIESYRLPSGNLRRCWH
jgi:hypothetical protein